MKISIHNSHLSGYRNILWFAVLLLLFVACANDDPVLENALNSGHVTGDLGEADSFTSPDGTLLINNDNISTNQTLVQVSLKASDAVSVSQYYFSDISITPLSNAAGWQDLDGITGGGLGKSELGVVIAPTGAGKSIVLDALSLLLGKRVERFSENENIPKSIIEGVFVVDNSKKQFFADNDLDFEIDTVVRREINQKVKSRAFINDTPVLLQVLTAFGKQILVCQYGQCCFSNPDCQKYQYFTTY